MCSLNPERLRHGVDLFNGGCFFDAHEILEDVWRALRRDAPVRRHLQGLVQLAVALHHYSRGNCTGALSVLRRGVRNLEGGEESFPDLDLDRLRADLTAWERFLNQSGSLAQKNSSGAEACPPLPKINWRGR